MGHLRGIALLVTLAFILVACGTGDSPSAPESEPAESAAAESDAPPASASASTDGPVKVALILPGNINDLSFNQAGYEGAQQLADEGLIELAFTEEVPEDAASVTSVAGRYINEGYELILANSFGYGDAIFELAEANPDVNFAFAGGINRTGPNVADYQQPVYQGNYLTGILAAGLTQSGTLGGIGAFDIPPCHAQLEAFKLGAQSVNPDITMVTTYTGDWIDVQKGQEAAQAQADQGADVFAPCGEGPALGAINVAQDNGLFAIGNIGDMSSLAPESVYASTLMVYEHIWGQMVDDVTAGSFQPGKFYEVSFGNGALDVALNEAITADIDPAILETFEETFADIRSGAFEVPFIGE